MDQFRVPSLRPVEQQASSHSELSSPASFFAPSELSPFASEEPSIIHAFLRGSAAPLGSGTYQGGSKLPTSQATLDLIDFHADERLFAPFRHTDSLFLRVLGRHWRLILTENNIALPPHNYLQQGASPQTLRTQANPDRGAGAFPRIVKARDSPNKRLTTGIRSLYASVYSLRRVADNSFCVPELTDHELRELPPPPAPFAPPSGPPEPETNRRLLTKQTRMPQSTGTDDADGNLIIYTGDVFSSIKAGLQYTAVDLLGSGSFGTVIKCTVRRAPGFADLGELPQFVAVKVVRNHPAYWSQATMEIHILTLLRRSTERQDALRDSEDGASSSCANIVQLRDHFVHNDHMCLVFEYLPLTLLDVLSRNRFRGLSLPWVRELVRQILNSLQDLHAKGLVHADVKLENIMLGPPQHTVAKSGACLGPYVRLIDFGSSGFEGTLTFPYIQSRFYRAPEAMLGCVYDSAIDIWSLGCVAAELFAGLPLFPGCNEHDTLERITKLIGMPPAWMIESGMKAPKFFVKPGQHLPISPVPYHSMTRTISTGGDSEVDQRWIAKTRMRRANSDWDARSAAVLPAPAISRVPSIERQPTSVWGALPSRISKLLTAAVALESGVGHRPARIWNTSAFPAGLLEIWASAWSCPYRLKTAEEHALSEGREPVKGRQYYPVHTLTELVFLVGSEGLLPHLFDTPREIPREPVVEALSSTESSGSLRWEEVANEVGNRLDQHALNSALKHGLSKQEIAERLEFADFLQGLLCMDPRLRMTPAQALLHPFMMHTPDVGGILPGLLDTALSLLGCQPHSSQHHAWAVAHVLHTINVDVLRIHQLSAADHAMRMRRENTYLNNQRRLRGALASRDIASGSFTPTDNPIPGPGLWAKLFHFIIPRLR